MKEPQCPAQDANGEGSISSTTGTLQESGQTEPSVDRYGNRLNFSFQQFQPEDSARANAQISAMLKMSPFERILLERVESLITLQSQGNSLLLALIEALGEDPDPEELHIPRPL